ncbi:hypothetical protein [uncultured Chitinophaga sp.]|uniref:hypothetical protein n=1 Tax=uncultured Chitinophaga sp. TaxID=339340 RepID=UPI0025DBC369|nr:hypothetical protein [uncultured Chitinophaga sp.]
MKDNIEQLASAYLMALAKTEERRRYWNEKTKPFVFQYLTAIAGKYPLPWKAGANELVEGLEAVYIALEATPSGIAERGPFNMVHKLKAGAFLSLSQNRNGQVIVWMSFPFIDGLQDEAPKKETFETVEPEEVDEALLVRCLEKFLVELANWEDDAKEEIGFLRK